ncbi:hypothetical protein MIC97_20700 [Aquamicrobium sp. NLF2-7]|uniref:hypothetical protein n=1 Tax=Aquamicrobium sp. NLF2-7 TaxID=2918753 RepID=UPI001EFAE671|nr:hypothetical protein [Aquamicrobium sp. NLF2-7]MCG8273906.1 hypothetical protein [Aquamicrobium sp. NLF2-7]
MPITRKAIAAAILGLLTGAAVTNGVSADTRKGKTMLTEAIDQQPVSALITQHMPAAYQAASRRNVTVDGEEAELARYERSDGRNAALGGEHFSTIIASNGRLKGFARMDLDLVGGALPSREETREIAMDFLAKAAPDLLPVLKVSWIEPHHEPLRVTRNGSTEKLTLTGMKMKMRNTADGLWMWVIVGADRKVMVFERDIHWITFPGHRGTEKWLHDAWLEEKGIAARST